MKRAGKVETLEEHTWIASTNPILLQSNIWIQMQESFFVSSIILHYRIIVLEKILGPRIASPHHTTPLHATPRHSTPRHATPRHATPRHATPRHATPRHATPHRATALSISYCVLIICQLFPGHRIPVFCN